MKHLILEELKKIPKDIVNIILSYHKQFWDISWFVSIMNNFEIYKEAFFKHDDTTPNPH